MKEVFITANNSARPRGRAPRWFKANAPAAPAAKSRLNTVAPGETAPVVVHLTEFHRTYIEALRQQGAAESQVPRGDKFAFIGASCAQTVTQLLPWLADRSGLPLKEQIAAARYLSEDVPALWGHVLPESRRAVLHDLEGVLPHVHQDEVRQAIQTLNGVLRSASSGNSPR